MLGTNKDSKVLFIEMNDVDILEPRPKGRGLLHMLNLIVLKQLENKDKKVKM